MPEFRFAFPVALLLLIPALIGILLWWRGQLRSAPPVLRYSDTRLLSGLPVGMRVRLRRLPDVLRLIAWVLLVVAFARPQFGEAEDVIRGRGIDVVIALDISESMYTADFNNQTRLDAARDVSEQFIIEREFDRIGLVIFEENAFYQAPPTLNDAFLRQMLLDIPTAQELAGSNRTALGLGLASATNMLRRSDAESRIIILLTDGANTAGAIDPVTAAQATSAFDIRTYTIGLGTSNREDNQLDEDTLRRIATITDGRYFNALNLDDLQQVYEQIDLLERSTISQQRNIQWQDQATIFLLTALILLIIERTLRVTIFQTIP